MRMGSADGVSSNNSNSAPFEAHLNLEERGSGSRDEEQQEEVGNNRNDDDGNRSDAAQEEPEQERRQQDHQERGTLSSSSADDDSGSGGGGGGGGEGYTPLQDLLSTTAAVSLGPGCGSEQGGGGAGGAVFYADVASFRYCQGSDDEDDDDSDTDDGGTGTPGVAADDSKYYGLVPSTEDGIDGDGGDGDDAEQSDSSFNFRAVADGALSALEADYRTTLLQQQQQQSAERKDNGGDNDDESLKLPPIRLASEDFGPDFFVATFDDGDETNNLGTKTTAAAAAAKPLPDIDSNAVRRAVDAIHLNDPKLDVNLSEWEAAQMEKAAAATVLRLHPIIPVVPLKAFHRDTEKAVRATATLSRAATISEAMRRLDLLQSQTSFRIDVVGCDRVECCDDDDGGGGEERMRKLFGPLVRWIGCYPESPKELRIRLVGPNVPSNAPRLVRFADAADLGRLASAELTCSTCVYEEEEEEEEEEETCTGRGPSAPPSSSANGSSSCTADLIVAFNAGIWGYPEWRTTIQHLALRKRSVPFVVTSYTLQEAEDDADTIREELSGAWGTAEKNGDEGGDPTNAACLWEPELNPLASKVERQTATAVPGRRYRENAAWQAWRI